MTTIVDIGIGTQYWVETTAGSGVFTKLAKALDINPPNPSVDEHESTNMDSPGRAKEFAPGLADYGETSIPMLYSENSDTDAFILAWRESGETRQNQLRYTNGVIDQWPGFVKGYQPTLPVNGLKQATLTVRNAGKPTRL